LQEPSSNVLKLKTLQNDFNLAMKDYETTYANYVSVKNDNNSGNELSSNDKEKMVSLLQILNNKLLTITNSISQEIDNTSTFVSSEIYIKDQQKDALQSLYSKLLEERKTIDNMLKEYDGLDQQYNDNSIYIQTANLRYMIFFILSMIILYYIVKTLYL